jgi:transcription elongation factor GreA
VSWLLFFANWMNDMQKYPMTVIGHAALETELKHLKTVERPEVIQAISVAREHGDLSENAEYHAAKEKQGFIEGRIQELESKLSLSQVIDPTEMSGDTVRFGATVKIINEDTEEESTYQIVGEDEANIKDGKVSITSPIARAMISKEVGDVFEVIAPGGSKGYEILEVHFI